VGTVFSQSSTSSLVSWNVGHKVVTELVIILLMHL